MTRDFPNLLVATEFPPNASGGGPAVVRQMLRDWPAKKLSWWSCLPEGAKTFGREVVAHDVASIPAKLYPHRRWGRQKSWILQNLWSRWAARHFARTLETTRPDAVWVIPHHWSIPPLAKVLPGAGLGFHVSIHDYADCGSTVQSFGRAATTRLLAQADGLYGESTTCDAICQRMADDLFRRVGRRGAVARAGLEAEDFEFLEAAPAAKGETIRIAYAGTILVEQTFALFVSALDKIRGSLRRPVTLEFFGSHSYRGRSWFAPDWMQEHGNLPPDQLAAALKDCTWGFSPMAMTDEDPRYNRFSLPTKFVSYLSAGLPVITLGHPESSVIEMAAAYRVGICATTTDAAALAAQLLGQLAVPSPAATFREAIRLCARKEFDAARMRSALHESLQKCAEVSHRHR